MTWFLLEYHLHFILKISCSQYSLKYESKDDDQNEELPACMCFWSGYWPAEVNWDPFLLIPVLTASERSRWISKRRSKTQFLKEVSLAEECSKLQSASCSGWYLLPLHCCPCGAYSGLLLTASCHSAPGGKNWDDKSVCGPQLLQLLPLHC